jgi:hypothetical protein
VIDSYGLFITIYNILLSFVQLRSITPLTESLYTSRKHFPKTPTAIRDRAAVAVLVVDLTAVVQAEISEVCELCSNQT